VAITIALTFGLFLAFTHYRRFPALDALRIDKRNDLLTQIFGLLMALLGTHVKPFIDPIGAIVIALIILVSWITTAYEQVQLLVGQVAPKDFLNRITYLALTHDPHVLYVDTVRAYHSGENYIVEVDVVMEPNLPLRIAHDVGEALQMKLECLPSVERAFVHIDHEFLHKPEHDVELLIAKHRSNERV